MSPRSTRDLQQHLDLMQKKIKKKQQHQQQQQQEQSHDYNSDLRIPALMP
jgi:hypothetical protein